MDSAFKGLFDKDIMRGFGVTILIIAIGQILIITFGGEMFSVVPLPFDEWVRIIIGTSLILWLGEIERWVHRMKKAKKN
jgi:Ca2+-transporting ATPase